MDSGVADSPDCQRRRDSCDTAEGDEKQRLDTAVPLPVDGAVFRDIIQQKIFFHKGIFHVGGDVVIIFFPPCKEDWFHCR